VGKSEDGLWGKVKAGLSPYLILRRVENKVGDGDPDIYYADRRIWANDGWIELKQEEEVKRPASRIFRKHGMRPSQINWFRDYTSVGVRCWIIVGVGDVVYLFSGHLSAALNDFTLEDANRMAVHYGEVDAELWRTFYLKMKTGSLHI